MIYCKIYDFISEYFKNIMIIFHFFFHFNEIEFLVVSYLSSQLRVHSMIVCLKMLWSFSLIEIMMLSYARFIGVGRYQFLRLVLV